MSSDIQNSEEILTQLHSADFMPDIDDSMYLSTCQYHPSYDEIKDRGQRRLIIVTIICLVFITAETVGGILSNSIAIVSDAAHLMTDFGAFMISLTAIWISSKPRTRVLSFGFHRAEVIGALISVLSIWVITGVIVYTAVQRIIYPDYEIKPIIMIYVSIGGIFSNLVMAGILVFYREKQKRLYGSDLAIVKRIDHINIKSAVVHVLGDFFHRIGLLIASLVIYFNPDLKIADPICTFMFSILVLFTTLHILRDILFVLMESFPRHLSFLEVQNVLFSIPGVSRIHNLRLWSLTVDKVVLCAHIVVHNGENHKDFLKNASHIIFNKLNIHETTLQVEEIDPNHCS